jgi:insulysin
MQMLKKVFRNRAFKFLRTEMQLGYIASAGFLPIGCVDGAFIVVQGTVESPYVVNEKIEEFITQFEKELRNMDEEDLQIIKEGAVFKYF